MNEQTVTHETMQADHRLWHEAHTRWRRDVECWQAEHDSAVTRLAELQKVVQEHGEALAEHGRAFRQAEAAVASHEREIADFVSGNSTQPQDVIANRHREQEGAFRQQQVAHERIQAHHAAVMKRLRALEATAAAAM